MNVVIENENYEIIEKVNVVAIEKLKGIFDVTFLFSKISSLEYEKVILDITSLNNYNNIDVLKSIVSFIKPNNLILVVGKIKIPSNYLAKIIEIGIYNIAYNCNHIVELYQSPNSYEDAMVLVNKDSKKERIIGFKNVTKSAGSTTLIYMLKRHLEKVRKVLAIEIDKMDFNYFHCKDMISTLDNSLKLTIDKYNNYDIIFIDINQSKNAYLYCDEIIYLIEPTMIKINQLMLVDPTSFTKLKNNKVILNKSMLDNNEIKEFENESHLKLFYNLSFINERKTSEDIKLLIEKLKL